MNLYYGTKLNQGSRIACLCIRTGEAVAAGGATDNVVALRRRPAALDQMPREVASP